MNETYDNTDGTHIWDPGVYQEPSEGDYAQLVKDTSIEKIIDLVKKRAEKDGEYSIANGHVGENNKNEPKMRRMMAFVADEKQILQCVDHIFKIDETRETRSVFFVCRDLANASTWAINAEDRKANQTKSK